MEVAMKTRWTMCALLALGLLLPAVARSQEALVVYSSVDEENAKKLLDSFTKATNVKVRFTFLSSGPAVARIEAEKNNPQADVWYGAPSENHVVLKEKGLSQPYVSPNAKDLASKFKDPEGYWTSFYMNPLGFASNVTTLKQKGVEPPTSWADLLKPAFKAQVQTPSPQTSGTGYNMVASLVVIMGEDKAFDYLKQLNPSIQTYTQSGTAPSKAAAIGQAGVGVQFTPAFLQLIEEGYPLKITFPKEGVGFEAPAISILKGAPHFELAKKLVDWAISIPGQNALTEAKTYFFPVHPKAALAKGLPAFDEIPTINYDAIWAGKEKKHLVDRWINEVLRAPK
jgi:iron(III) transport system substrate-binding protein